MKKLGIIILIVIVLIVGIKLLLPKTVVVLGYHDFTNSNSNDEFIMNSKDFERQIKYLSDHHYKSLTLKDVECFLNKTCKLPRKSVLITMDDGWKNELNIAIPILNKYKMNAVIFYIGYNYGKDYDNYLNKKDIEYIKNNYSNIEIASHTYNMHYEDAYLKDKSDIIGDIKKQKEIINSEAFAYPYGLYNETYIEALKEEGYKLAFTFGPGKKHRKVKQGDSIYEIPRLNMQADYPFWKFKLRLLLP